DDARGPFADDAGDAVLSYGLRGAHHGAHVTSPASRIAAGSLPWPRRIGIGCSMDRRRAGPAGRGRPVRCKGVVHDGLYGRPVALLSFGCNPRWPARLSGTVRSMPGKAARADFPT